MKNDDYIIKEIINCLVGILLIAQETKESYTDVLSLLGIKRDYIFYYVYNDNRLVVSWRIGEHVSEDLLEFKEFNKYMGDAVIMIKEFVDRFH